LLEIQLVNGLNVGGTHDVSTSARLLEADECLPYNCGGALSRKF
jgi:hypothetical protein